MRLLLISCLLALSTQIYAQDFVNDFLKDISGSKKEVAKISISGKMLQFASLVNDESDEEFKELVKNIDKINIVEGLTLQVNEKNTLEKNWGAYDELMTFSDGAQYIRMFTREKQGEITEFIMCVEQGGAYTLFNILGKIDLKLLSKLSSGLNMEGMKHLEKVSDKEKTGK
ncbi:hypothetical protein M2137_001026 [Parabacteroides sp. PFB2-10]|uniref:DUF4252 domain-containing protein n=1 Tax=Parabacteroides sp. PFB2-10 TaxID=1742405 RepID=UPI002474FF01|nr:DUF4252 domain-containing protein [Parabacteroides sp. PFB2-10]MDH6312256.1 hypothetical protein [Parabacteroides sp. PFB2-10]MDL2244982.1 DUF4252 domain-containing protein [Parabacteroides sp. OttesenSCG-928-J18]